VERRRVALLAVLTAALPARADVWPDSSYKALPCRPTIGCTADIVPPGVVEIEAGYLYRRLYTRAEDLLATLHVSKDIRWLHVDVCLGLNLFRLDGAPLAQAWAALALTFGLAHGLAPLAEVYYFADAAPLAGADGGVLIALTYQPRNWIVLDLGADAGLVPSTRAVSAFAGVTIIPLDLWDTRAEKPPKP
jgi:hypothetical protein